MVLAASPPPEGDTWLGLTETSLDDVGPIHRWCVQSPYGAVVLFSGTVRDHAEGRWDVTHLVYEAYTEQVVPRLTELVVELRRRWPTVGRVAVLHRVGRLELTESSVVVAVSAPHRDEAFDAARFGIDTLKATAPIWKQEHHRHGVDWGSGAQDVRSAAASEGVPSVMGTDAGDAARSGGGTGQTAPSP